MDQETKDYLDAKFAAIDDKEERLRSFATERLALSLKWRKRMIGICVAILLFLLGLQAFLLYWFQLRGF